MPPLKKGLGTAGTKMVNRKTGPEDDWDLKNGAGREGGCDRGYCGEAESRERCGVGRLGGGDAGKMWCWEAGRLGCGMVGRGRGFWGESGGEKTGYGQGRATKSQLRGGEKKTCTPGWPGVQVFFDVCMGFCL